MMVFERGYNVIALVDTYRSLTNKEENVLSVNKIKEFKYDFILITPNEYGGMLQQIRDLGVPNEKIKIMVNMNEFYESIILGYSYWGQHCEDLVLATIFTRIGLEKPTYMDLGANHPIEISNTYFLYRQGCRGINIDANPNSMAVFDILKPEDINLNIGISKEAGLLPFYVIEEGCGLNTFSKYEVDKLKAQTKQVINLPVVTLESVVEKYCPNGFPDFLDCDIEGLDYDVLNAYDLISDGPKVICVEVRREDIKKFDTMLINKGYFRFCRLAENNIYVKNEYSEVLCHMKF